LPKIGYFSPKLAILPLNLLFYAKKAILTPKLAIFMPNRERRER